MTNYDYPGPGFPQDIEDIFFDLGLDPADYIFSLSDVSGDPDIRQGDFETLKEAIIYLTEEAMLLPFSRVYQNPDDGRFLVAIPDDTD